MRQIKKSINKTAYEKIIIKQMEEKEVIFNVMQYII